MAANYFSKKDTDEILEKVNLLESSTRKKTKVRKVDTNSIFPLSKTKEIESPTSPTIPEVRRNLPKSIIGRDFQTDLYRK